MTIEDGYAIQREWVTLELAEGRRIRGRKIGLTSRAMQLSSRIDEPDHAPLMDDLFFEQGGDIPIDRFIAPRVEVELAFVLGKPLAGPGVTLFDVLAATEYVCPALEIITSRTASVSCGFMRRSGNVKVSAPASSPAAFHTGAEMPVGPDSRSLESTTKPLWRISS